MTGKTVLQLHVRTTDESIFRRLDDEAWRQRKTRAKLALQYIKAGLEQDERKEKE